jgi:CelD/BcsL family acetyltransferase involved in cellulose biosynthesis
MRAITSIAMFEADVDAWRDLVAAAVEPNPFFDPDFALPAARGLGASTVQLLVVRDGGGEWLGLLPVRRAGHWRRMPSAVTAAWSHPYCFVGTPLVRRGTEDQVLPALIAALRRGTSLVARERLAADGPVADALDGALDEAGVRPIVWATEERAALHRREDGRYVELTLGSKRRRELRRQRSLMEAELGCAVACVDATGDPAAVDAFLELEAAGWKGRAGTAMEVARAGEFFREACRGLAERGRLQLLLLRCGDRLVAAKCNLVSDDAVHCFKIAYDETLGRFSPGVQLELENIRAFHDRTELGWMDSCAAPDNQMINRLWPDRRRVTTLLVPGAGAAGRVGRLQAEVAAGVRHRLKEHA